MPETSRPSRIGLALALVVGCALTLLGWTITLGFTGPTGARRVAWYNADGLSLPSGLVYDEGWTGCSGDIHLRTISSGRRVWTTCGQDTNSVPHGGLAVLDVDARRGVVMPLPAELPLSWSEAVQPLGDRLAFVYRVAGSSLLAAGVAAPDGWRTQPVRLPGGAGTAVIGLAWRDDAVEIVVLPADAEHAYGHRADPVIVRLGPGDARSERTIALTSLCPPGCEPAVTSLAYLVDGRWRFLMSWFGDPSGAAEVDEHGVQRPHPLAGTFSLASQVDAAAVGLLGDRMPGGKRLGPDGQLVAAEDLAVLSDPAMYIRGDDLTVVDGHLRTQPRGRVDGVVTRRFGERTIASERRVVDGDETLVLTDRSDPAAPPRETTVARIHSFSCGDLGDPVFMPQPGGGHLLVAPNGCYVEVDAADARVDPLELREHLRRRGSIGQDWNEPWYAWMLAWVLFGLPLSLAVGASFHRARTRRAALSTAAALIYVVSAAYFLVKLSPLLR